MKSLWKLAVVVSAASLMAACGGGSDTPTTVATSAAAVTVDATTGATAIQALASKTVAFSAGVPDFGTTTATDLAITAPATGTPTFAVSAGGSTASGDMSFGSCIFTIKASSFPAGSKLAAGNKITVNPCAITLNTAGVVANGMPVQVDVTITLNGVTSAPVKQVIAIAPSGAVVVNNVTVTVTKTAAVTGS